MSVRVLTRVMEHSQAENAERLVMFVLADAAWDDGVTWISQEDVAEAARLSRPHVNVCIAALIDAGELELRKAQRGRRRINVYRVMLADRRVEYDRLPFDLSEKFGGDRRGGQAVENEPVDDGDESVGTLESLTSSGADDVRNDPLTTSEVLTPPASSPSTRSVSNRKGVTTSHTLTAGFVSHRSRPKTVDRSQVTDAEFELASSVLAVFNLIAHSKFTSKDYVAKIVMRIREHPELSLHDHATIVRRAFEAPWWRDAASPSVVYGNGALFERAMHAVGTAAPARVLTPEEIAAYRDEDL